MTKAVFEAALGVQAPWEVKDVVFDEAAKTLRVHIDFARGTRFAVSGHPGQHPVHDTEIKTYRHLNFFQHECFLEVRTPRVVLPNGQIRLVTADFAGRLSGFTLLFEALILMLSLQMPFAAVARIVKVSPHRVLSVCRKYVEMAVGMADLSAVRALAIDETSRARGHDYVTLAADPVDRKVLFVTDGFGVDSIARLATHLDDHGCPPGQIDTVSIDMSPAFISGVTQHLPEASITFDKFHVIAHANHAVDLTRRSEQRTAKQLKGMRWTLLKDPGALAPKAAAALADVVAQKTTMRTARAWLYKERLREILNGRQVNVAREALQRWCTSVMRSNVEPMKKVAKMVRSHLEGIVAWARSRQTNGFLEAINGLFQAAKRRARGFTQLSTIRTVIFLIAGKLDFASLNEHAG